MNSEYSNNPLTEVALALSMAFFSIMVLTIFALSHKSKTVTTTSNEKISVSSPSSVKTKKNENRSIIFYFEDNFYNQKFKKWHIDKQILNPNGYTVAVPSEISVKKLFEIRQTLKKFDIKITQQNKKWNDALTKNIKKKGIIK